jgi:ribosome-associated translation inhibitor RaiA
MRLTITFASMSGSEPLKDTVKNLYSSSRGNLKTSLPKSLHVGFCMENGPLAEGADVFSCSVLAKFANGRVTKVKRQAGTAYDAARECFEVLERELVENKRKIVDSRNNSSRRDALSFRRAL